MGKFEKAYIKKKAHPKSPSLYIISIGHILSSGGQCDMGKLMIIYTYTGGLLSHCLRKWLVPYIQWPYHHAHMIYIGVYE